MDRNQILEATLITEWRARLGVNPGQKEDAAPWRQQKGKKSTCH